MLKFLVALLVGLAAAAPAGARERIGRLVETRAGIPQRPIMRAPMVGAVVSGGGPTNCARPCTDGHTIWAGEAPAADPLIARFGLAHELGHLADRQYLDDAERAALTPRLGYRADTAWDLGTLNPGGSPDERFADAYAACLLGLSPNGDVWIMTFSGYSPTGRRHRRTCAAIGRALAS